MLSLRGIGTADDGQLVGGCARWWGSRCAHTIFLGDSELEGRWCNI